MAVSILTWLVLLVNIALSAWNAYASGYNSVILQRYKGKFADFFQIANSFGLVLAFAGMAYSLAVIGSLIAASLGYLSASTLQLILAYNQLVFGGLLIVAGMVITIESILIASMRRDFWSIFTAVYNTLITIWNVYAYIRSFRSAMEIVQGGSDDDRRNALLILIAAAIAALFIVYGFYSLGKKRAEEALHTHA